MTNNEKKFLDELTKLFEKYSIDEVRCEEKDGAKYIMIYSNDSYLSFRIFKDGKYYEILSLISEYVAKCGGEQND